MAETTQKARTRARILDEAARAMREHGSEGIGVAALMKRAGLTHGGFYAHFENREDMVAHAVDRMFQDSAGMLQRHLGQQDAATGLRALVDYYLSDERRRDVERGCPLPGLGGEAMRMPAAARKRFESGVMSFCSALERAMQALGLPEPKALSSSILAEMVGAMTMARAVDDAAAAALLEASRTQIKRRLGLLEEPGAQEGSLGATSADS